MEIRKAKLKDVEQIVNCAVSLLKYHYNFDSYFALAKDINNIYQKYFKTCIYSKNCYLLVAEENGKIIAYALGKINSRLPVYRIKKFGLVSDMFVEKKSRRLGIAQYFLIRIDKWFKEKGLRYMELTVHVNNEIGKSAWAKYGFKDYMIKRRLEVGKLKLH